MSASLAPIRAWRPTPVRRKPSSLSPLCDLVVALSPVISVLIFLKSFSIAEFAVSPSRLQSFYLSGLSSPLQPLAQQLLVLIFSQHKLTQMFIFSAALPMVELLQLRTGRVFLSTCVTF